MDTKTDLQETVLIGSQALLFYGIQVSDANDWDLLCTLEDAKELAWLATRKAGPRTLVFDDGAKEPENKKSSVPCDKGTVVDLMVTTDGDTSAGRRVLYSLMHFLTDVDTTTIVGEMSVRVCPRTLLCALYRGHIHRIPQVSHSQEQNVDTWCKYMSRFHALRDHIGYKAFDALVETKGSRENQVFQAEFDYVCTKLGDAASLQDKHEDVFFKDNVKRYVDHDELHARVAKMNRGKLAEPLFSRFQRDDKSVEMDRDLFMQATPQERLDTLKEEIMVLFLERKAIPAAAEYGVCLSFGDTKLWPKDMMILQADYDVVPPDNYEYNKDDAVDQYNNVGIEDESLKDFRFIVCHFMTNLCGDGHSWLRRYALDHWPMLNNVNMYPVDKMCTYANTFRREALLGDAVQKPLSTIDDFLAYASTIEQTDFSSWCIEQVADSSLVIRDESDYFSIGPVHDLLDTDEFLITKSAFTRLPVKVAEAFRTYFGWINVPPSRPSEVYLGFNNIIINARHGFGFSLNETCAVLYVVKVSLGERTVFGAHKLTVPLDDAPASPMYMCAKSTYKSQYRLATYYRSTCDGGYDKEVARKFLNKYGRCFSEFDEFFERIARQCQDVDHDEPSYSN